MSDHISPDDAQAAYNEALRRIEQAEKEQATRLELFNLPLTELPPNIGKLTNLQSLYLIKNSLTSLPPEIGNLTNLQELDLRQNSLSSLPPEIGNLTNLQELDLRQNSLTSLPPEIGNLTNLQELDLRQNSLTSLPPEIGQLTNLQTLYLGQNSLTSLPPEIVQLTNLTLLDLRQNSLTSLPPEIVQLANLQLLDLGQNSLTSLPPEIGQLTNLQTLYLGQNSLTSLPPEIVQLTNLTWLDLRQNSLTSLPPEIVQLANLQLLDLRQNSLTSLPPEIVQLTNMTRLYLGQNILTSLPPEIVQLTNLTRLDLRQNPKLLIPPEISSADFEPEIILDYLKEQMKQPREPLHEAKLVLVGQGGVGKTSLVKQLLFNQHDPNEAQTKGINIEQWAFKNVQRGEAVVDIQLNVWDFGGQEIMHATHQFFMTKRSIYLLVLDARQGEQEGRVEYWLALIRSFAGDSPVLIVLNKSDEHHLDLNRRGLQEKYPNIVGFVRTSARTGDGIDTLKQEISTILSILDHVDTPFPQSWYAIKTELERLQEDHNFLPYHKYQELCEAQNIVHDSSQRTLIQFLHDLGILLNFQDDERVSDTNILNPQWVTRGVYAIITNNDLAEQNGILPRNQLPNLLDKSIYPRHVHQFILLMMEKFELAYPFDGGTNYLIPDLLPKEQPAYAWDEANSLQFEYHYAVLPYSILHRFIVREHRRIHENVVWRTGVMLAYEGMVALIKADIEDKKMSISIGGNGRKRDFLSNLRYTFDSLHESIVASKPTEHVPIPGHPGVIIPYKQLLMLEEKNVRETYWLGVDDPIDVLALLGKIEDPSRRHLQGLSRQELRNLILEGFGSDDLPDLCFLLNIEYDDLSGDQRTNKVLSLIRHMENRGRTDELIDLIAQERPHLFAKDRRFRASVYR